MHSSVPSTLTSKCAYNFLHMRTRLYDFRDYRHLRAYLSSMKGGLICIFRVSRQDVLRPTTRGSAKIQPRTPTKVLRDCYPKAQYFNQVWCKCVMNPDLKHPWCAVVTTHEGGLRYDIYSLSGNLTGPPWSIHNLRRVCS